ncbi:hypothetical protein V8G54_026469 [Vigna mungo]|uniref:Uncharacterized protein n=1 Tax=Vigna mungo TaxID=3915 RepID=A0AAQ3N0M5_VIGMU
MILLIDSSKSAPSPDLLLYLIEDGCNLKILYWLNFYLMLSIALMVCHFGCLIQFVKKNLLGNMRFSTERSSNELQTVAFEMLSKAISRAGSSSPVHIWRSILEVFRKTMDILALKPPVVEDSAMSRFYESFLCCLHLILIDPKCAVSGHVSVFVVVLRMLDSESSTINVTSSDSEFSDGDRSANDSGRVQNSRVRVAAITCIQVNLQNCLITLT